MPLDTLDSRHVSSLKKSSYVKTNLKKKKGEISVQWLVSLDTLDSRHVSSLGHMSCIQRIQWPVWTHVVYPTHPVATGHWTKAKSKKKKYMELEFHVKFLTLLDFYPIGFQNMGILLYNFKT